MLEFLSLNLKTFALDISDLSLKIIKLKKKRNGLHIVSYGEVEIPMGIIKDGEIKNENSLSEIIKNAVKKTKGEKLKTKYVVVSLPEQKSFLQVITIPRMEEEELKKAVKFEAENYIPLPIDDVYLDFQKIQTFHNNINHFNILIVALPKIIVDSYVSSIKKAGLIPIALEVESQAISRALIKNKVSKSPVLLIDLGATRTGFTVFSGYSIYFTTSIPISSQEFTNAIAKNMDIDLLKAEKLKQKYGLESCRKISFRKKIKGIEFKKEFTEDKRILKALAPLIIKLTREIKKYLDYCQTHKIYNFDNNSSIEKIILCGGGANLKGLDRVLSLELEIPTIIGDPWVNLLPVSIKKSDLSYEKSLSYTTAIGLALRDIEKMNY